MAFEKAAACKIQTAASTSYLAFLKCPLQRVQFKLLLSLLSDYSFGA